MNEKGQDRGVKEYQQRVKSIHGRYEQILAFVLWVPVTLMRMQKVSQKTLNDPIGCQLVAHLFLRYVASVGSDQSTST